MDSPQNIEAQAIERAIEDLADQLYERYGNHPNLVITGIANGGIAFASRLREALQQRMQREIPSGILAVTFHRDDILTNPIPKSAAPTRLPVDVTDATVILADDVLDSGRTARAALNELFDSGRPERVVLVVLFDRKARKLPICADHSGFQFNVEDSIRVKVQLHPEPSPEDSIQFTHHSTCA